MEKFCINPAYIHREEFIHFDDTPLNDEWQDEVYELAAAYANISKVNFVIDIGCGSGFKLLKYFKNFSTMGVDVEKTVSWLKEKYPDRTWATMNSNQTFGSFFELVICSDVVEHMERPDLLLESIAKSNFRALFISTPDRARLPEDQQLGPPVNVHHMREWTSAEFRRFVSKYFRVLYQTNLKEHNGEQQLLICSKK